MCHGRRASQVPGISSGGELHRHWAFLRPASFTGTRPSTQALGLSSGVELPEVLDVPGVRDGYPILSLQARGARPGDMDDLERALPHG